MISTSRRKEDEATPEACHFTAKHNCIRAPVEVIFEYMEKELMLWEGMETSTVSIVRDRSKR